jgi:hypothetical protein
VRERCPTPFRLACRSFSSLTFQWVQSHRDAPSIWNADVATPHRNFLRPGGGPVLPFDTASLLETPDATAISEEPS